jgi:hypothetical protein
VSPGTITSKIFIDKLLDMHTNASFAVALGAIVAIVSGAAIQSRSIFCTPGEGLCALGIQTNFDGSNPSSWDTTVYDDACNVIGNMTFQAADGFSSLDSQLPYTVEIRVSDLQGFGTRFDYAGLGFGPGNGRNRWGCAACGDSGQSQCCGYSCELFVYIVWTLSSHKELN